jgi:hypothetical protein
MVSGATALSGHREENGVYETPRREDSLASDVKATSATSDVYGNPRRVSKSSPGINR